MSMQFSFRMILSTDELMRPHLISSSWVFINVLKKMVNMQVLYIKVRELVIILGNTHHLVRLRSSSRPLTYFGVIYSAGAAAALEGSAGTAVGVAVAATVAGNIAYGAAAAAAASSTTATDFRTTIPWLCPPYSDGRSCPYSSFDCCGCSRTLDYYCFQYSILQIRLHRHSNFHCCPGSCYSSHSLPLPGTSYCCRRSVQLMWLLLRLPPNSGTSWHHSCCSSGDGHWPG